MDPQEVVRARLRFAIRKAIAATQYDVSRERTLPPLTHGDVLRVALGIARYHGQHGDDCPVSGPWPICEQGQDDK